MANNIKAVIFDIGATLVTGPPVAPNKVIAKLLDGVTPAEVSSIIMTTELNSAEHACEVLENRFGKIADNSICEICNLWESQCIAASEITGAIESVKALKNAGYKIGLLSDIWNPYYASVETAIPDIISLADSIVLSCRAGARKPCADNFNQVLTELNVTYSEAVMVGDTYSHDILPAIGLGMKTIWVLARPERESEAIISILNGKLPNPTVTIPDINDILDVDFLKSKHS